MHAPIQRRAILSGALGAALGGAITRSAFAQDVLGETGLRGAGSTLVYPLLSKWSQDYRKYVAGGGEFPAPNSGLDDPPASSALEYEPVGSLAGTLRLKDRAVDFAASDMPFSSGELAKLELAQFPMVFGGVTVAVNLDGVGPAKLKLTGAVLARIFSGKIRRWSDMALLEHNSGLKLPDAPISVVYRSDGSGTTFTFTDFLSKRTADWRQKAAFIVSFPNGKGVKGNQGVAEAIRATKNSIGYVDHAHAAQHKLTTALIQNRAGRFIKCDAAGFKAASVGADWKKSEFHVHLSDAPGENAYPITATVFALMHKKASRARTEVALDFFRWSLERGAGTATRLGYVPLPAELIGTVTAYWKKTFGI